MRIWSRRDAGPSNLLLIDQGGATAFALVDAALRIRSWSRGFEALLDAKEPLRIGDPLHAIIGTTIKPLPPRDLSKTPIEGSTLDRTARIFFHPHGSQRWLELTITHLPALFSRPPGILAVLTDRTEEWRHQESEERRRREASGLRAALEQYGLFSVADRRGRIIDVNAGFCRISGYSREELLGQDHRILNSGYHPRSFWLDVWRTIASGKSWRGEVCNRAKDGHLYWVDSLIVPQLDEQGRVERYISSRFEITARKEAERALVALREHFDRAVEGATDGLWEWDPKRSALWTSDRLRTMLGLEDEVPHPRPITVSRWLRAVHPIDRHRVKESLARRATAHEPIEATYRLLTRDGAVRWVRERGRCFRDADGNVLRIAGSMTDITRERTIEDRLQLATRTARIGLWDWEIGTGKTYFDEVWFTMLDYAPNAFPMTIESWRKLVHQDDLPRTGELLERHLSGQTSLFETELRMLSAGGDWRWIRTSGQVVERNALGQPIRMLGLHVITHELREALAAAESATRAKGEFLANMSHEIRTPMTAVLGDAELLEAEARAGTLPERIETAVASIGSHTRQLLGIMSDILEVSQIDAGRVTLTPVPTDPRQLVEEALAPHRSALEAKGLGLSVSVDADVPPQITTDPSRCHRILTKLIGNAIKFTASGSVRIQLRCDRAAQRLCVDVSDTGIGLTDIEREALLRFDAFHQTDASMSRRYGGTGLGLRIAHSLAALLGGQISIRSCRGQGSTFTLQVPTGSIESEVPPMAPLGASAEDTASALLPLEGLHLLLVDDNAVNQRVVGLLLERAGARLTRANDGQDAIVAVAAADAPFHVIIMDMQMPVLDGYAATRGLRDQGYQHPIVALTAHALSGDRERCLAAGCDDYLTKPVDKALLIATCARQALRHGPIAPSVHKTPGSGPAR